MHSIQKLQLARLPTPIQLLAKTSAQVGKEIYLWRDDLTGFNDSGNKLRKLEYLVADALAQGCDHLITCGGPQSNHTRATAAVARQLGLGISILVLPKADYNFQQIPTGNLLLNQIFDAKLVWLKTEEYHRLNLGFAPFLAREVDAMKAQGKKPYVIPLGGSSPVGCLGYEVAVTEMLSTWRTAANTPAPDSLFCALGSGGTYLGLKMGIEKEKLATHLYGVAVSPLKIIEGYVAQLTQELATLKVNVKPQGMSIIDGYVGDGYAIASDDDLRFYQRLAREEGVLLDPCYTGKAFQGMLGEIAKYPDKFGKKILFLHSGGGFGTFAYAKQYQKIANASEAR